MSIIIKNYHSVLGVTVKSACLVVTDVMYSVHDKKLSFHASVFTDEESYLLGGVPLERDAISGEVVLDEYIDQNLIDVAKEAIETKINLVKGKTPEECEGHMDTDIWIDIWEYSYNRFVSDESDTEDDDEYVEAAKILLGEQL